MLIDPQHEGALSLDFENREDNNASVTSDHSPEVGQCPRMSPLYRPLHALFLPATSVRRTTVKAISALHADARKPSLLRDSVSGARQGAPQSSALRLCRPPLRYAPSTSLIAPFQGSGPLLLHSPPCWRRPEPRRLC
jgi:hypothetical protein